MKPEYQDYYKFLVSLGLVFISLSFTVPWIIWNASNQQLSAAEISALPAESREIAEQSSEWVSLGVTEIPYIFAAFLASGLGLFVSGVYKWNKRQRKIDADEDLKSRKLKQEVLGDMTADEVAEKALRELGYQVTKSTKKGKHEVEVSLQRPNLILAKYMRIQQILGASIEACVQDANSYRLLRDRNFGQVQYNLILESKSKKGIDTVIEIRYADKEVQENWVKNEAGKVVMSSGVYKQQAGRSKVIPTVIFVIDPASSQSLSSATSIGILRRDLLGSDLHVKFVREDSLLNWKSEFVIDNISPLLPPVIAKKIKAEKEWNEERKEKLRNRWRAWVAGLPRSLTYAAIAAAFGLILWGLYGIIPIVIHALVSNPTILKTIEIAAVVIVIVWVIRNTSAPLRGSIRFSNFSGDSIYARPLHSWGGRSRIKKSFYFYGIRSILISAPPMWVVRKSTSEQLDITIEALDMNDEPVFSGIIKNTDGQVSLTSEVRVLYEGNRETVIAPVWFERVFQAIKKPIQSSIKGLKDSSSKIKSQIQLFLKETNTLLSKEQKNTISFLRQNKSELLKIGAWVLLFVVGGTLVVWLYKTVAASIWVSIASAGAWLSKAGEAIAGYLTGRVTILCQAVSRCVAKYPIPTLAIAGGVDLVILGVRVYRWLKENPVRGNLVISKYGRAISSEKIRTLGITNVKVNSHFKKQKVKSIKVDFGGDDATITITYRDKSTKSGKNRLNIGANLSIDFNKK